MQRRSRKKQFAKKLGLTPSRVWPTHQCFQCYPYQQQSQGKLLPDNQTLKLICREFGVNLDYLLHGEEPMFTPKRCYSAG